MGKQFVAVPFADLGAELGRSVFADPDLAHRQHDMRVRLRQPVGTDIPMDIEIGDHAPVDELGLYKITSELDALFLRHLARDRELDLKGRSEERRVGKKCVSTIRSWGSPYH